MSPAPPTQVEKRSHGALPSPAPIGQQGLRAELRVILAAVRKEWIHFVRYPTWAISFLLWPIVFPLGSIFAAWALSGPDGSGLAHFAARTGTTDSAAYVVIGNAIWMWVNMVLWNVGTYLRAEQMRGTLEASWLAPTRRFYILLGSSLAQALSSLLFLVVTAIEVRLVFGTRLWQNPLPLMAVLLLSIPCIYGLGIAFASLVMRFKEAGGLVNAVRGIVMIFVGVSHPITVLPQWMQGVSKVIPFTYTIEGLRRATLTRAGWDQMGDVLWPLALSGVILAALGWACFQWMERRSFQQGGISHY